MAIADEVDLLWSKGTEAAHKKSQKGEDWILKAKSLTRWREIKLDFISKKKFYKGSQIWKGHVCLENYKKCGIAGVGSVQYEFYSLKLSSRQ